MLTQEQIQQFYRDGFVTVRGVIPPEQLAGYREAFERMIEKVRANPSRERYNTRLMKLHANPKDVIDDELRNRECWGVDFLLHPDLYEPAFTDYLGNEKLLSSLASLLGDDLRISGLKALWSPRYVDYDLTWHRDGPKDVYSKDGTQPYIQFNTALYQDESFRVIPGSHLRPLTEDEFAQASSGVEDLPGQQICTLEPGDAMFMHACVFHRGKAPRTAFRRTLHYIIARADDPVGTKRLNQFKGWYEELGLADKLAPVPKKLFDNFFAWEGRTFDDSFYPGLPYKD